MITGVRGLVVEVEPAAVVVAVGPLDVRLGIPARWAMRLTPGQEVELRTSLYVRENQIALYGFPTRDEQELFDLLLTVSGIGPRAAMNILSTLDATEVRRAIAGDDPRALARAPGVGLRAATRIVSDLRPRISATSGERAASPAGPHGEAVAALVAMGYSATEARQAVDRVSSNESLEAVLREALAILAERAGA